MSPGATWATEQAVAAVRNAAVQMRQLLNAGVEEGDVVNGLNNVAKDQGALMASQFALKGRGEVRALRAGLEKKERAARSARLIPGKASSIDGAQDGGKEVLRPVLGPVASDSDSWSASL